MMRQLLAASCQALGAVSSGGVNKRGASPFVSTVCHDSQARQLALKANGVLGNEMDKVKEMGAKYVNGLRVSAGLQVCRPNHNTSESRGWVPSRKQSRALPGRSGR